MLRTGRQARLTTFFVGERLLARYARQFYPAIVDSNNGLGSWKVLFDDSNSLNSDIKRTTKALPYSRHFILHSTVQQHIDICFRNIIQASREWSYLDDRGICDGLAGGNSTWTCSQKRGC